MSYMKSAIRDVKHTEHKRENVLLSDETKTELFDLFDD